MRLPGPDDPLTVVEQADLRRQLTNGAMADLLPCELENVLRMHATLEWYRLLLMVAPDTTLPERVRHNGINYLREPEKEEAGP